MWPRNSREWLLCAALVSLIWIAFAPVWLNQFVNYDDGVYIHQNPQIQQGLSWAAVRWAFTTGHAANWHPLTWIVHTLNWQLFGNWPPGHHAVSLALHSVSSVALFLVLVRMTGGAEPASPARGKRRSRGDEPPSYVWPAWFVAALFPVHPLRVESVAWAAELKDVLCTLFWWLTLAAYTAFVRQPSRWRYGRVLLCFALGLLSKPMIVTLPVMLLLLDYWPLQRWAPRAAGTAAMARQARNLVVEKLPLFALALLSCVATYVAQSRGGTTELLEPVPLHLRLANATLAAVAYLGQAIWPVGLACFYPYPRGLLEAGGWARPEVLAAAAFLLVVSVLAIVGARRYGWVFVGWCWYLVTLVPVIGLIQVGRQARADRYTYVPLVGIFLLVTWSLDEWSRRRAVALRPWLAGVGALILVALTVVTMRQVTVWHDDVTLFGHAARVVPHNETAHHNLGTRLVLSGRTDEGIAHLKRAIELRPDAAPYYRNLAITLEHAGRAREAVYYFRQGIRHQPEWSLLLCNLAMLYATSRDPEINNPAEALRLAQQAVSLDHGQDPVTLEVLLTAQLANGQTAAALDTAQRGLALARQRGDRALVAQYSQRVKLLGDQLRKPAPQEPTPAPH